MEEAKNYIALHDSHFHCYHFHLYYFHKASMMLLVVLVEPLLIVHGGEAAKVQWTMERNTDMGAEWMVFMLSRCNLY